MHSKQYGGVLVCVFKPGGPVFIIVENTSCSSICCVIYARQKFFHNALTFSVYSYMHQGILLGECKWGLFSTRKLFVDDGGKI